MLTMKKDMAIGHFSQDNKVKGNLMYPYNNQEFKVDNNQKTAPRTTQRKLSVKKIKFKN